MYEHSELVLGLFEAVRAVVVRREHCDAVTVARLETDGSIDDEALSTANAQVGMSEVDSQRPAAGGGRCGGSGGGSGRVVGGNGRLLHRAFGFACSLAHCERRDEVSASGGHRGQTPTSLRLSVLSVLLSWYVPRLLC